MRAPDPLLRAALRDSDAFSHAPASETPPPQPTVEPKTGIAKLCGETPLPPTPSPVTSDFGPPHVSREKRAISSEVGTTRQVEFPQIDRARFSRNCRGGYRREAPPSTKNASGAENHGKSQGDVTRGAKSGPIRGEHPPRRLGRGLNRGSNSGRRREPF